MGYNIPTTTEESMSFTDAFTVACLVICFCFERKYYVPAVHSGDTYDIVIQFFCLIFVLLAGIWHIVGRYTNGTYDLGPKVK